MEKIRNEYLRHTLSTIAYRFQKSVRKAKDDFGEFNIGNASRNPNEIINHMFHILNATRIFIQEERFEKEIPEKLSMKLEIERFNLELKKIDNVLADKELGMNYSKKLLQGPFSDILTHIVQISMLSRLNDNPIEGEDFSSASIKTGIVSYLQNKNTTANKS